MYKKGYKTELLFVICIFKLTVVDNSYYLRFVLKFHRILFGFRFVQDQVNGNYFKENPITVVYNVIQLLEHVVVVFDLYANEEKLNEMHHFLKTSIKQIVLSDSNKFVNILDQWRLRLFRLHVDHIIVKTKIKNNIPLG